MRTHTLSHTQTDTYRTLSTPLQPHVCLCVGVSMCLRVRVWIYKTRHDLSPAHTRNFSRTHTARVCVSACACVDIHMKILIFTHAHADPQTHAVCVCIYVDCFYIHIKTLSHTHASALFHTRAHARSLSHTTTYNRIIQWPWSVTHMNESRHTMNESRHTYAWVLSHIWMNHVTHS